MTENSHAAVLHAIADHIAAHPQLCPVAIQYANSFMPQPAELQVTGKWGNDLTDLAEWARSLGVDQLTVKRCGPLGARPLGARHGAIHMHGTARLDGHDINFWSAVPALDHSGLADTAQISVREMFRVAADTAAELAASQVLAGEPA